MKHTRRANGISNQKTPVNVWLYVLLSFIRIKYSKSGIILPIISAVAERFNLALIKGKTIAGCENVNGIKTTNVIIVIL